MPNILVQPLQPITQQLSNLPKKHPLEETIIINVDDDNENQNLSLEPSKKKSRTSATNKTENYKQKSGKNFWWVPREQYINAKIAEFLAPIQNTDVEIAAYSGQRNSSDPKRAALYEQLRKIAVIVARENIPPMKHGHSMYGNIMHRALVSYVKGTDQLTGACYFQINLDSRICILSAIQLDNDYHGKSIGSYLLHTMILIGLLYGCDKINCISAHEAKGFYDKSGFIGEPEPDPEEVSSDFEGDPGYFELDFLNDDCRDQFLNAVKKWNPASPIKKLINQLRANIRTLDQKEKLLADLMGPTGSFRPEENDIPALAYLASYKNRELVGDMYHNESRGPTPADGSEDENESDEKEIRGIPVAPVIAGASTNHSATSSSTAQTGVNATPVFSSSATMWKQPSAVKQTEVAAVQEEDKDEWWLTILN